MKKVIDYLNNVISLQPNDIIVVGVSTGPDSMALLDILYRLRENIKFKIVVAHVNHNLRVESEEEARFLKEYCIENDLFFEYMKIEKYGDDNFHNEAHNLRYNFFESVVRKYRANYLMTGHHADDLTETILMRLVRGSSFKGYSGFSSFVKKDGYSIVRPLVFVTKEELEKYVNEHDIPYYIDKSNLKDKYTRNRYRHSILPFLKEEDPKVTEKFFKFSQTIQQYDEYIDSVVFKEIGNIYSDGMINLIKFLKLDKLIQTRIIDYLFAKIYMDDLMLINDRHVELFFKLVYSNKPNVSYCLPNNYLLIKSYSFIYFKKMVDDISNYDMELNSFVSLPNGMTIEKISESESNGNDIMRLASESITLPLRVRTRKNGDKIHTLNGGTKKVKDIFIEKKIPIDKRDFWPIVVDSTDKIVWIPKLKKSKYNRLKNDTCDIIFKCC